MKALVLVQLDLGTWRWCSGLGSRGVPGERPLLELPLQECKSMWCNGLLIMGALRSSLHRLQPWLPLLRVGFKVLMPASAHVHGDGASS